MGGIVFMNEHFFLDGYDVLEEDLASVDNMRYLLTRINKNYFNGEGNVILIPYFGGKVKEDGGVSGIILSNNCHFTCHTFCYKQAMFVDYFGNKNNFDELKKEVLNVYETNDFDLCTDNIGIDGNFGKHLIFNELDPLPFDTAKKVVEKILTDIEMTPINNVIINYVDEEHFDLLQPIAESHISIHRDGNNMVLDAFSCKWFDEEKLARLVNSSDYKKICRGVKYK